MTVFQNELDDATINALPKLKQSIALLLKKTNLTAEQPDLFIPF